MTAQPPNRCRALTDKEVGYALGTSKQTLSYPNRMFMVLRQQSCGERMRVEEMSQNLKL